MSVRLQLAQDLLFSWIHNSEEGQNLFGIPTLQTEKPTEETVCVSSLVFCNIIQLYSCPTAISRSHRNTQNMFLYFNMPSECTDAGSLHL